MGVGVSAWTPAIIDRVEVRTPRIHSVYLRTSIPRFAAGQHVDVKLTAADGYSAQRSYSIASAPSANPLELLIELLIERLDDGEVSPYFADVAQAGDTCDVRGPIGGHFVWRPADGGPLLLIAGGSGIAPLLSITRHWAASTPTSPLTLLYSARTWDDVVYAEELLALEARQPQFALVITTTRGPKQRLTDAERRIDRALIGDALERFPDAPDRCFVCGSTAFVDVAASGLVDAGVPASAIRTVASRPNPVLMP